jgi:hypothetical protein
VGDSLRVARGAGALELSWADVGAGAYSIHVAPLGSDLTDLGSGPPAATVGSSSADLPEPAGTVFLRVFSGASCGG